MRKTILNNEVTKQQLRVMLLRNGIDEKQFNETYPHLYVVPSPQFNLKLSNGLVWENQIHHDKETGKYLLESRLFKSELGSMEDAFLMVYEADGTVDKEQYDDVWEIADWKVYKE